MLEFKIVFSPGYIFKLYDSLDDIVGKFCVNSKVPYA